MVVDYVVGLSLLAVAPRVNLFPLWHGRARVPDPRTALPRHCLPDYNIPFHRRGPDEGTYFIVHDFIFAGQFRIVCIYNIGLGIGTYT